MNESKRTVIVIGAGIIGAAIAFELQGGHLASSRIAGVWYATGYRHLGLTFSATTARLMADMMTDVKPEVDINRY